MNRALLLLASALVVIPAIGQEWTDRDEYDLVLSLRSEAAPKKRLELLDAWTHKYPQSKLLDARLSLYLATYENLGDAPHMLETARAMFAAHPMSPVALFWCTVMAPQAANSSPEILDLGDKAARQLLAGLDTFFNAANKPASVVNDEWQKEKSAVEFLAHRTLGWTAWQRGQYAVAEKELGNCLENDPQNPEITAWMGIVLGLDKGKEVQALWQLSRAAAPGGKRTLAGEQKREVNAVLERVYASYHGAMDGFEQLRSASAASPFPKSDFNIESASVVAARRAEELLRRTNPELASWLDLRKQLDAADGEKYFADNLQSKDLPRLKGTIIRCTPERSPREVVLSMNDPMVEEVTLKLKTPLPYGAEAGTQIAFQGVADSFAHDPFHIVVLVEKDHIEGWPDKPTRGRSAR